MSPPSTVHKCHAVRTSLHIVPIYGLLSQYVGVMFISSLLQVIDRVVQSFLKRFFPPVMLLLLLFNSKLLLLDEPYKSNKHFIQLSLLYKIKKLKHTS